MMKLSWLPPEVAPTASCCHRWRRNASSGEQPSSRHVSIEYSGTEQHATQKATSMPSASDSRTHSESVDTAKIPAPANSHPSRRRSLDWPTSIRWAVRDSNP